MPHDNKLSITEMFLNRTTDGVSAWLWAHGDASNTSGREVQRDIKVIGELGGATYHYEVDYNDGFDPAPILNGQREIDEIDKVGILKIDMVPGNRVRLVLSGSTGTTNVTAHGQ